MDIINFPALMANNREVDISQLNLDTDLLLVGKFNPNTRNGTQYVTTAMPVADLMAVAAGDWKKIGNVAAPGDFIGTLNNQDFRVRVNNLEIALFEASSQAMVVKSPNGTPEYILRKAGQQDVAMGRNGADWYVRQGGAYWIAIKGPSGFVGMGTTLPTERLHVVGSILMDDGNQNVNYVMTCDGTGKGTWTNPATLFSGWSLTGNAGTNPAINFLGTTDNADFLIKRNSIDYISLVNDGSGDKIGFFNTIPAFNIDGFGETRFIRIKSDVLFDTLVSIDNNTVNLLSGFDGIALGYNKEDKTPAFAAGGYVAFDIQNDKFKIFHSKISSNYILDHEYDSSLGTYFAQVKDNGVGQTFSSFYMAFNTSIYEWRDLLTPMFSRLTLDSTGCQLRVSGPLGDSNIQVNPASVVFTTGGAGTLTFDSAGMLDISGKLRTGNPGSGSGDWRLGKVIAAASVLDATSYVEVEIDGVIKKLALIL
jgi:hypothetical protein